MRHRHDGHGGSRHAQRAIDVLRDAGQEAIVMAEVEQVRAGVVID